MLRVVLFVTLLINVIACSSTPGWKGIYSSGDKEIDPSKLEVPPDLSAPDVTGNLSLPNIAASGSSYSDFTNTSYKGDKVSAAIPQGVKVIRDGVNQWLEINTTAEKLWPELKIFFAKVGFEIKREEKNLGVMETNWLENRPYLPSNWFSKLLNRVSSTGLRDKYRARLESTNNPNVTRLFISHQGLKEHGAEDVNSIKIWWEARPSDPELEAEMYQRFLIFRGAGRAEALNLVKKVEVKERARLIEKNGTKVLQVAEGFDRTWRRVGIALDRIGLLVDDRNRSGGIFYLRISDDFREKIKEDKGWFANLFGDNKVELKDRYLLRVEDKNSQTELSIYEATGAKADERFVSQLLADLKLYLD